jgi:hypothetical protein
VYRDVDTDVDADTDVVVLEHALYWHDGYVFALRVGKIGSDQMVESGGCGLGTADECVECMKVIMHTTVGCWSKFCLDST